VHAVKSALKAGFSARHLRGSASIPMRAMSRSREAVEASWIVFEAGNCLEYKYLITYWGRHGFDVGIEA
jgi:hypothetical protein